MLSKNTLNIAMTKLEQGVALSALAPSLGTTPNTLRKYLEITFKERFRLTRNEASVSGQEKWRKENRKKSINDLSQAELDKIKKLALSGMTGRGLAQLYPFSHETLYKLIGILLTPEEMQQAKNARMEARQANKTTKPAKVVKLRKDSFDLERAWKHYQKKGATLASVVSIIGCPPDILPQSAVIALSRAFKDVYKDKYKAVAAKHSREKNN